MRRLSLIFVLFASLLFSFPTARAQHTFWVSPLGSGEFNGADTLNCFPGLQTALSYIRYFSDIPGDANVTLNIMPGTYYMTDDSTMSIAGYDFPYLIMQGVGDEKPIISGLSETPITDWVSLGGNIWEAPWPYDYGYYAEPDQFICGADGFEGWIGCLLAIFQADPFNGEWRDGRTILRREMLMQGDLRLSQVSMPETVYIRENSFCVPLEGSGTVRIRTTSDPNENPVYSSVCQKVLSMRNGRGIELHNLEFAYGSPFIKTGMVDLSWIPRVTVSDCDFHHSNAYGLAVRNCPTIPIDPGNPVEWQLMEATHPPWNRIENVRAYNNGIYGMMIAHSQAFYVNDCVIEYNNWRGYEAGTVAYDAGGIKFFRTRRVVVNNYVGQYNYGHGLWFDKDGRDITVTNSTFMYNMYRGLFIERCFGPVLVDNCLMSRNSRPIDDDRIYRFRSSALSISACDVAIIQNSTILSQSGFPVLIHSVDYIMEDGIIEPYGEEIYFQAWNNQYYNNVFSRSPEEDSTFFTFGVDPYMARCYYHFHTVLEDNEWYIGNIQIPKYWVMSEGTYRCPPIDFGNLYDLRDFYDTPWDDDDPEARKLIED
jgi:Right handed beta helix region